MQELTRAEEQIMQVLWKIDRGFVKDILKELPEPKPAYNTISTIVRILEKKGFVGFEAFGKSHQYFPIVSKVTYTDFISNRLISNYFDGSFKKMVSFFANNKSLDVKELDEIMKILNSK